MSEYIVSVPDEAAEYFIARFGLDGTKMMGYDLTCEIVRCRDCKYREAGLEPPFYCLRLGEYMEFRIDLDDFCKWGKKRGCRE